MKEILTRILSTQALAKAAELIKAQPDATTKEEGDANHARVVDGVLAFVEDLDNRAVRPIPFAGPILEALVDTPQVDAEERKWVAFVVETAYQSLKFGGAA